MTSHWLWIVIACIAVVAFVVVWAIEHRKPGGQIVAIERAFAFVMVAGALGGAGYVLATGVGALDESSSAIPGATSASNSSATSTTHSTGTSSSNSDPTTFSDPSGSKTESSATSADTANASSSAPGTQPSASQAGDLLRELMVFVLAFAILGVLLLIGGIPWAQTRGSDGS